jgi:exodeoxyribonuclease VII small subunit
MPSAKPSPATDDSPSSFEQAMEELESILHDMDNERLPLEEMIEKYDRGTKLLQVCQSRLQAAQQKVELINAARNGQTASLSPLVASSAALPETEPTPTPAPAGGSAAPRSRKSAPRATESEDDNEIRLF